MCKKFASQTIGAVLFCGLATGHAYAETRTDVICAYAPSQSAAVNKISYAVSGAGAGALVTLQAAGLTVVPHVSGSYILTGAGGYVAGTMAGATAAAFAIPATVAVGGSAIAIELMCAPKNHPGLVSKVMKDSRTYWSGKATKVREVFDDIPESSTISDAGGFWGDKIERYLKN